MIPDTPLSKIICHNSPWNSYQPPPPLDVSLERLRKPKESTAFSRGELLVLDQRFSFYGKPRGCQVRCAKVDEALKNFGHNFFLNLDEPLYCHSFYLRCFFLFEFWCLSEWRLAGLQDVSVALIAFAPYYYGSRWSKACSCVGLAPMDSEFTWKKVRVVSESQSVRARAPIQYIILTVLHKSTSASIDRR